MSLVSIVRSEEQLSGGSAWCQAIAEQMSCEITILVIGKDRKTLAEFARRKMAKHLESTDIKHQVQLVDEDVDTILEHLKAVSCQALLIVHRTDDSAFQQQLFQASMVPTIVLSPKHPPPKSANQVFSMFRRPSMITTLVCEKLLGFAPSSVVCENIDVDDLTSEALAAMESKPPSADDVVFCAVENFASSDPFYKAGLAMLDHDGDASFALVQSGHSYAETIASKIDQWAATVAPPMDREQRTALASDLKLGSKPNLEFLGLMSAAAMLASFGLLQDSAAVIIGAMLIAPLMTPILGAGMSLAQGNRPVFQSAILTIALGFLGALVASVLFGWLFLMFQERTITGEMWARCRPSPLDFCVGLVGGIAASYARTRRHLSSALAGAAIAAALVPPIATAGLQLAFRAWDWENPAGTPIVGPLLLVSINVLTIMVGSSFVLWARGMRSDRTLNVKDRWAVRMVILLLTLVVTTLIWILRPFEVS